MRGLCAVSKGQTDEQYIDELIREKKAVEETYHASGAITLTT